MTITWVDPISRVARWWVMRRRKPIVFAKANGNIQKIEELIKKLEKTQEELEERERSFEALVMLTSSWVWKTDADGNYCYVSNNVYDLYGFKPEQVLGRRPYEFVDPSQRERVKATSDYLVATHRSEKNFVAVSFDAKGNVIYTKTSCVPIFDKHGNYKGHLGTEEVISKAEYDLLERKHNGC